LVKSRGITKQKTFGIGGVKRKPIMNTTSYQTSPSSSKDFFDKRVRPRKFQEGDLVMVYDNYHDRRTFKKFLPKQFGPYMVMKVFYDNNTYELVHLDGEEYGKINHDKLKHFHTP